MRKITASLKRFFLIAATLFAVSACTVNDDYNLDGDIDGDITVGDDDTEQVFPVISNYELSIVDLLTSDALESLVESLVELNSDGTYDEIIALINELLGVEPAASASAQSRLSSISVKEGTVVTVSLETSEIECNLDLSSDDFKDYIDMLTAEGSIKLSVKVDGIPTYIPALNLSIAFTAEDESVVNLFDNVLMQADENGLISLDSEELADGDVEAIIDSEVMTITLTPEDKDDGQEDGKVEFDLDFADLDTFTLSMSMIKTGSITIF